jgi:hypothetical protein
MVHEKANNTAVRTSHDSAQVPLAEYATLLSEAITVLSTRLDEIRLPLHVLAENHFGELNENQEELIASARTAADAAVEELRRLQEIVDTDRGVLTPVLESVGVGEVVRSLTPMLKAQAEKEGVTFRIQITPLLPRIQADRARLRDALDLAMTDSVRYATPGSVVTARVTYEEGWIVVDVEHGSRHAHTGNLMLAQRLVGVQGGQVADQGGVMRISLPVGHATAP